MMSPITERKPEHSTIRYQFTCADDEVVDEKFLELSDDVETWLFKSEVHPDLRKCINDRLSFSNDSNVLDSSCRHIDSRTYTRRKRCSLQPGLESCWETDMHFNTPKTLNSTQRSSLGILTQSLYNKAEDTDLLDSILKFTPLARQHQERDSLDCIGSDAVQPKHFKLELSNLTPILPDFHHKTNNLVNTTFDKPHSDQILSEITAPCFSMINSLESSIYNSLNAAESTDNLEFNEIDINNMTNLSKEILCSTDETENIAPTVNVNISTTTDKPFNTVKNNLNTTQTISQNKTKSSPHTQLNGTMNVPKTNSHQKSLMNTTFTKSQLNGFFSKSLNNTFTKSVDALNGAGDDQALSTSESSLSSCSNLPRSVGDLHCIARLQEESLEECNTEHCSTPETKNTKALVDSKLDLMSTPKSTHLRRSPIVEMFGEEPLSPIRKSGEDGNVSDHSEQSSASSLSTYSSSSHNNNFRTIPHSMMGDNDQQVSANSIASNISRPIVPSRLRMPVAVSQLPVSRMIRPPSVHSHLPTSRIIRPPLVRPASNIRTAASISAPSVTRPVSRLPAPRYRGRSIPKPN